MTQLLLYLIAKENAVYNNYDELILRLKVASCAQPNSIMISLVNLTEVHAVRRVKSPYWYWLLSDKFKTITIILFTEPKNSKTTVKSSARCMRFRTHLSIRVTYVLNWLLGLHFYAYTCDIYIFIILFLLTQRIGVIMGTNTFSMRWIAICV